MNQYIEGALYLAGVIITVGSAVKVMRDAKTELEKPHKEIKAKLEHHDECLKRDDQRLKKLESENDSLREDMHQVMLVMLVMLSHMESGNNTGEIVKAKNDLNRYLIERK